MSDLKITLNPFSVNNPELLSYYSSIVLLDYDISKLKEDLKSKTDALIEVQKNHKRSYEEKIELLKATCTHVNDEGTPAKADGTEKLEWANVNHYSFNVISQCEICGKSFKSGSVELNSEMLGAKSREMMMTEWENTNEFENFDPNMDFDFELNNPISVIEEGRAIPIFNKQTVREEMRAADGTVLGVRFVKKNVLNID
jgi:hypothetical protein